MDIFLIQGEISLIDQGVESLAKLLPLPPDVLQVKSSEHVVQLSGTITKYRLDIVDCVHTFPGGAIVEFELTQQCNIKGTDFFWSTLRVPANIYLLQ
jgi:hypothetical protein